ncbi:MAG TPA: PucR family transcriptional regulator ligand-binding domain-containing protein, partial [Nocardioidaceae bacterium]|nr:PucR family transcriptional regulator ligand-binding domain-containing protein [Nocardioidaceae bacterium]
MSPTVRTLLADRSLGLRLLAGERLDVPIRWVATSELEDPTPFLLGGELLLTTGIPLGRGEVAAEGYVRRLLDVGVVGLGFGIGVGYDRVPEALVTSADRHDLPLLEVDRPTPFIAISKTVSDLLAEEHYAGVTHGFRGQQQLTRAAVRSGSAGVARRLADLVGGWVLVLDATGAVRASHPKAASGRAAGLADHLDQLRGHRPAASSIVDGDEHVTVEPLGTEGRVRGFLVLGVDRALTTTDRAVLQVASALLSFAFEGGRSDATERAARSAVLRMLMSGGAIDSDSLADLGAPVLASDSLWVVLAEVPPSARSELLLRWEDAAADRWLVAEHDDRPAVVVSQRRELARVESAAGGIDGVRLGCGGEVSRDRLADGVRQAQHALTSATASNRQVVYFDELAASGAVELADPAAATAFAEAMLAPLDAYRDSSGIDLCHTLRVWLDHHGQFDP